MGKIADLWKQMGEVKKQLSTIGVDSPRHEPLVRQLNELREQIKPLILEYYRRYPDLNGPQLAKLIEKEEGVEEVE